MHYTKLNNLKFGELFRLPAGRQVSSKFEIIYFVKIKKAPTKLGLFRIDRGVVRLSEGRVGVGVDIVGREEVQVVLRQNAGCEDDAIGRAQASRTLVGIGAVERNLFDAVSGGNQGDTGRFDIQFLAVKHDGFGLRVVQNTDRLQGRRDSERHDCRHHIQGFDRFLVHWDFPPVKKVLFAPKVEMTQGTLTDDYTNRLKNIVNPMY